MLPPPTLVTLTMPSLSSFCFILISYFNRDIIKYSAISFMIGIALSFLFIVSPRCSVTARRNWRCVCPWCLDYSTRLLHERPQDHRHHTWVNLAVGFELIEAPRSLWSIVPGFTSFIWYVRRYVSYCKRCAWSHSVVECQWSASNGCRLVLCLFLHYSFLSVSSLLVVSPILTCQFSVLRSIFASLCQSCSAKVFVCCCI